MDRRKTSGRLNGMTSKDCHRLDAVGGTVVYSNPFRPPIPEHSVRFSPKKDVGKRDVANWNWVTEKAEDVGGWIYVEKRFTIPDDVKYLRFGLVGVGKGEYRFDDIVFQKYWRLSTYSSCNPLKYYYVRQDQQDWQDLYRPLIAFPLIPWTLSPGFFVHHNSGSVFFVDLPSFFSLIFRVSSAIKRIEILDAGGHWDLHPPFFLSADRAAKDCQGIVSSVPERKGGDLSSILEVKMNV
jgi:hypothetical protein